MPNKNAPAAFASTALMILRNRLSERVWGCHGVHTLPITDRSPGLVGTRRLAIGPFLPLARSASILSRTSRPPLLHSDIPSDLTEGIGVIGDSISDEYRFYAPDRATAWNWVEILAASRGLNFGNSILASGGSTGDRRFAYNWSQSGATTTSLIARGQNAGLAAQVAGGAAISLAVITIGANDFADVLFTSRSVAAMWEVLERASANFTVILESLLCISSTLKVAVFTAVDLRVSPIVRGALNSGLISARLAEAYGTAVQVFNDRLNGLVACHGHRVVVVDVHQLLSDVVRAHRYVVGGLEFDRIVANNGARHLFLADGFHPGTIGQCLVANRFLAAINSNFNAGIRLLDGEEMVRIANSVPKPSRLSLIGTGVLAVLGYGRRRPRAA